MEEKIEETEQFKIFYGLMKLALIDSNAVFSICAKVIISLSQFNEHTPEEFDEILEYMRTAYKETPSIDEILKRMADED